MLGSIVNLFTYFGAYLVRKSDNASFRVEKEPVWAILEYDLSSTLERGAALAVEEPHLEGEDLDGGESSDCLRFPQELFDGPELELLLGAELLELDREKLLELERELLPEDDFEYPDIQSNRIIRQIFSLLNIITQFLTLYHK